MSISAFSGWESLARRTTYFFEAAKEDGSAINPLQAMLESSANGSSKTKLSNSNSALPLKRQSTRYSAHGIHDYRGKFNPQIVRAIINILGLRQNEWILDPFCGSGTTLLEAAHTGLNAIGLDLNPLAIQIAEAKIASMHVDLTELEDQVEKFKLILRTKIGDKSFESPFNDADIEDIGGRFWQHHVPSLDYSLSWFPKSILIQLIAIFNEIDQLPSKDVRLILRIILSDMLRDVSYQDPKDLRIRRRKNPIENAPVYALFLETLTSKIDKIIKARKLIGDISTKQYAILEDARFCSSMVEKHLDFADNFKFNAAITSPPYATALPYIDTQRLSLVLLGLISSKDIHETERRLIGNREISSKERGRIEDEMDDNAANLPSECLVLCRELKAAVDKNKDGFRRQNVSALVYKYMVDMGLMFHQINYILKRNSLFVLVVGRNETKLGGNRFLIDTPKYLILLAEQNGFKLHEKIELDTYKRFDIHQNNSIKSESLILLRSI